MLNITSNSITRHFFSSLKYFIFLGLVLTIFLGNQGAYAQTPDKVVAVVNGNNITQKQLDETAAAQLFALQQQIYAIRKAALENLVLRSVLEGEAAKRGISVEALKKQMTDERVEVPRDQVEQLYLENASVLAGMNPDEAKERLRLDLESQARMQNYRLALARLKEAAKVEIHLEEPKLPALTQNDAAPSLGSSDAIVTITEFSDFECPYCRASQPVIRQVLKDYGKEVRLVFKHLPLDIHADAFLSAQAAFCAGQQGMFWQYHDALFASAALSRETLTKIAGKQGLNLSKFGVCLTSDASRAAILADTIEARQLGISSTPTFVINGTLIKGAIGFDEFKSIIERESRSHHTGSALH